MAAEVLRFLLLPRYTADLGSGREPWESMSKAENIAHVHVDLGLLC